MLLLTDSFRLVWGHSSGAGRVQRARRQARRVYLFGRQDYGERFLFGASRNGNIAVSFFSFMRVCEALRGIVLAVIRKLPLSAVHVVCLMLKYELSPETARLSIIIAPFAAFGCQKGERNQA